MASGHENNTRSGGKRPRLVEDDEGGSESEYVSDEDVDEHPENQIVDFEGRSPMDCDFNGIKLLLEHQLFLKAPVNVTNLTELIISQNYVGSVVKQSDDYEDSDDEDDNEDSGSCVFGVATVINLRDKPEYVCLGELRELLLDLSKEYGTAANAAYISKLLAADESEPVGFLINERYINISSAIASPLFEWLLRDMNRAIAKNMPYRFSYYVIIGKIKKMKQSRKKREQNGQASGGSSSIINVWENAEEEKLSEMASCQFEFPVDKEKVGESVSSYRRLMILPASAFETFVNQLKSVN